MDVDECTKRDSVYTNLIFDAATARAYRFGVAEAFNITLKKVADHLDAEEVGKAAGSSEVLAAIFEELGRAEDYHSEKVGRIVATVESVMEKLGERSMDD